MEMTKNQLALIKYVAENNLHAAKKIALACCAEDTTQKHRYQIARYKKLLLSDNKKMIELPRNISGFATLEDLSATYIENRYYIAKEEKEVFELIKKMSDVSLKLMEKQISYLNATLLYGESGVGKTAFSRYVAYKLRKPYLYINFSKMLESLLGGTAKNLTNLFNFINKQSCVVMLDEIDSLAIKRQYGVDGASSEISRSTTCLLQLLDTVSNDHIILAATNLEGDVDSAVKRRFTLKHEIKRLSPEDNEKFITQYLKDVGFAYDLESVKRYAKENHSQAEILTHVTRSIADTLIENREKVVL